MKTVSDKTFYTGKHSSQRPANPDKYLIEGESVGKSRITMRIDNDVLAVFKAKADKTGGSYQTMMNSALKQFAEGMTLSEIIRQAIHETLEPYILQHKSNSGNDPV